MKNSIPKGDGLNKSEKQTLDGEMNNFFNEHDFTPDWMAKWNSGLHAEKEKKKKLFRIKNYYI